MLAIGAAIGGRYQVQEVLGHGGMGAVYAVATADRRRFAMKTALPDLDDDGQAARRLAREANALQLLDHPHIVGAVELVADGGRLYLVVELVAGRPLGELIAAGPLSRAARRSVTAARGTRRRDRPA